MIEPNDLKMLAEGMGKERAVITKYGHVEYAMGHYQGTFDYEIFQPHLDQAQSWEVLVWMAKKRGVSCFDIGENSVSISLYGDLNKSKKIVDFIFREVTPEMAIVLAAIALIKEGKE